MSGSVPIYDVIIIGYGPSGAVAANLLGQRGVRVLVIERLPEIIDIPRAVHFDGEVMRIFQSLGLAEAIQEISTPASGLVYLNASGKTLIKTDLSGGKVRHGWPRGHYFSQPELESQLRKGTQRYSSVEVRLGWNLVELEQTNKGVNISACRLSDGITETFRARYLLGCDGGSSTLRKLLGTGMRKLGQASSWLVCDTMLARDIEGERPMYQVCDPARPTTIEPCNGRHVRWEFSITPSDSTEELAGENFVRSLMEPYLHLITPSLQHSEFSIVRNKTYTFRSLVATRWRYNNVFLLGDAAHLTPPFLGQGMCAGIRDAFNLCWKLHGVIDGHYGQTLLDTYQSEREPHVSAAIRDATRIGMAIQLSGRFKVWLRDLYLIARRRIPFLTNPMEKEASWPLGPGLFDSARASLPRTGTGNLFDQALVTTQEGMLQRIDDLLGTGFAVLCFGLNPRQFISAGSLRSLEFLDTQVLRILPRGGHSDAATAVVDSHGDLADWRQHVGGADVAIIRPDRQVFGLYHGDPAALKAKIEHALSDLASGLELRPD